MLNLKEIILNKLKSNRPKLSDSSLKTYTSLLFKLYNTLEADNGLEFFNKNEDRILKHLEKNVHKVSRKTVLSAYFILSGKAATHKMMIVDAKSVNDDYKLNKKSDKQEKNWISKEQIIAVYNKHKAIAMAIITQKVFTEADLLALRDYVILGLYTLHNPRRSLDYAEMKYKNFNKNEDNYIKNGQFVFNIYKTSKYYGMQTEPVDKDFMKFLKNKYFKLNPTEYVLFDSKKTKLSSSQITKLLNKLYDGNVSVDILRHVLVTDKLKGMPSIQKLEELASSLGHNVATMLQYAKKD